MFKSVIEEKRNEGKQTYIVHTFNISYTYLIIIILNLESHADYDKLII